MTAGGVGLALLLQGSHGAHGGRAAAAATAAAAAAAGIAAAAAAEGWLELPRHRNPFVARANAATAAAPQRSMCPLGFRVGEDPKAMYKVSRAAVAVWGRAMVWSRAIQPYGHAVRARDDLRPPRITACCTPAR